jgi:hypothetical protein
MLGAREWATNGWAVTLVGLTSGKSNCQPAEPIGEGSLEVVRVHRRTYQKQKFASRLVWTILANVVLLGAAFSAMRRAEAVLFTGSPPLMLHFIAPLNALLRKRLIYRIMDFHPDCLIAELGSRPVLTRPGPRRSLQPAVRSHKPGADVDSPIKSCRGCGPRFK